MRKNCILVRMIAYDAENSLLEAAILGSHIDHVKRRSYTPVAEVLSRAVSIFVMGLENQTRWAGHLVRMDDSRNVFLNPSLF